MSDNYKDPYGDYLAEKEERINDLEAENAELLLDSIEKEMEIEKVKEDLATVNKEIETLKGGSK